MVATTELLVKSGAKPSPGGDAKAVSVTATAHIVAAAAPPPPKHEPTAAAAVVLAAAVLAPATAPFAIETAAEGFRDDVASLLVKASFATYNDGHCLPYVSYKDRPLRDTDLNRRLSACDWYEGGGGKGAAVSVLRGGRADVPKGWEPEWWWNRASEATEGNQKPDAAKQPADGGAKQDGSADAKQDGPSAPPGEGYEEVVFLNCDKTNTQMWLYCNKPKKSIIVAFRGTHPDGLNLADIGTDLDTTRIPLVNLHGGAAAAAAAMDQAAEAAAKEPRKKQVDEAPMVHRGFFTAYARSVGANGLLSALIDEAIQDAQGADWGLGSGWRVAVTGHSLGGALATLAAYDIANGQRKYGVSLYTYGAPRLGNAAFVQRFKERMTGLHEAFRVVFPDDRVPRVPDIKFGYCHTGKLYRFGKGNKLAADPEAQLREEKEARDNQPESQNFGTIAGYAAAKFFANAGDIMRSLIKRSLADDIKGPHCIYKDLLAPNA